MRPNEKQKIEIEKFHRDPLPPLNQGVTEDSLDFLGTALLFDGFLNPGQNLLDSVRRFVNPI
jgi:hypothetical protein